MILACINTYNLEDKSEFCKHFLLNRSILFPMQILGRKTAIGVFGYPLHNQQFKLGKNLQRLF